MAHEIEFIDEGHELVHMKVNSSDTEEECVTEQYDTTNVEDSTMACEEQAELVRQDIEDQHEERTCWRDPDRMKTLLVIWGLVMGNLHSVVTWAASKRQQQNACKSLDLKDNQRDRDDDEDNNHDHTLIMTSRFPDYTTGNLHANARKPNSILNGEVESKTPSGPKRDAARDKPPNSSKWSLSTCRLSAVKSTTTKHAD